MSDHRVNLFHVPRIRMSVRVRPSYSGGQREIVEVKGNTTLEN